MLHFFLFYSIKLYFLTIFRHNDKLFHNCMMYFTFIFLSWSPGIPRILRRCLALEREYCVNFEPYINDELSELVKTYGYRIEVPANTYYIKPGQKLTEITYIASGSTSHSMFGLTGKDFLHSQCRMVSYGKSVCK